jgi:hypothetical protein
MRVRNRKLYLYEAARIDVVRQHRVYSIAPYIFDVGVFIAWLFVPGLPAWGAPGKVLLAVCIAFHVWVLATTEHQAWRNFNAERKNLCPNCGYDLRASPERCPECGTVSPKADIKFY